MCWLCLVPRIAILWELVEPPRTCALEGERETEMILHVPMEVGVV